MYKQAKILTPLQEHQQKALEKALERNMIFAHGTGTGKTLTSIALADAIGKPTTVFVPAPLVNNYNKELVKHKEGGPSVEVVSLPTAVSRQYQVPKGNTVIIDEAHSLRNSGTQRLDYLKSQRDNMGRVFALTGTPAYNNVTDYATLANLIAGEKLLPENTSEFRGKYVSEIPQEITWYQKNVQGLKPGVIEKLKNSKELKKKLSKYVDVFYKDIEKPKREDKDIYVEMTKPQRDIYSYVVGQLPKSLKYKLENNLPPTKQEAANLNSFLVGSRQVSNSIIDYHNDENYSLENSPKLKQAVKDIRQGLKDNPAFKAFVYTNFIGSGIKPLTKLLDEDKIPYQVFTGGTSQAARQAIVNAYNSGEKPVLIGSGAATEGLDLKGTRMVQILEPHFNNSKIEQAIGRGVRYKSHAHLPMEDRSVIVNKYYSVFQDPNAKRNFFSRLFGKKTKETVDQYLRSRALEKEDLVKQFKEVIEG